MAPSAGCCDGRRRAPIPNRWPAGSPPCLSARAVVEAEAILWATQLLSALDWSGPEHRLVGFDRSVLVSSSPRVVVRGRVDVEIRPRFEPSSGAHDSRAGLLVMMAGHPLPSARLELGVTALAAALSGRRTALPATVVGLWPQCGRALALPVDVDLLLRASDAVVEVVRTEADRTPRQLMHAMQKDDMRAAPERAAS